MSSSLFRRLIAAALALVVLTLLALNYVLTSFAARIGAPVDPGLRTAVLAISLFAALLALAVGLSVSRALTSRVRRLKRAAEGLLGAEAQPGALSDPNDDLGSLERSLTGVGHELRGLVSNLRFESARREAILSGMAEGVLAVDPDLKVTFCNQALLAAIGFRGSRYEGFGLLELVRDPALYEMIRSVRATGEPGTLRFHLSADTPRTFEAQATPLAMPSGRGVIAIFHDITDLERLEQVRKDFVANVSHELRTPLAGIIGYADTLLDGALDDTANRQKFVEIIRANAVRLGSIAADLLVLSELESGADQETEMVSVRAALESGPAHGRLRGTRAPRPLDPRRHGGSIRRRQPLASGASFPESAGQRHQVQPSGRRSSRAGHPNRRRPDSRSDRRHRRRHSLPGFATHLRALLPRRQSPLAPGGRHRPGTLDREACG